MTSASVIEAKTKPTGPPEQKRRPHLLRATAWPCVLCAHGHYPGTKCGVGGCACRG
jgi:hypothetical protein